MHLLDREGLKKMMWICVLDLEMNGSKMQKIQYFLFFVFMELSFNIHQLWASHPESNNTTPKNQANCVTFCTNIPLTFEHGKLVTLYSLELGHSIYSTLLF